MDRLKPTEMKEILDLLKKHDQRYNLCALPDGTLVLSFAGCVTCNVNNLDEWWVV